MPTPACRSLCLYTDLAEWWPLLSAPADYEKEAAWFARTLRQAAQRSVEQVLELGCGGGNNASFLKRHFAMTLVDVSAEMLAVSRGLNAECTHIEGDMRTARLNRTFDAVFIHDAVAYLTTREDLQAALLTAALHCRPGGVVLIAPDVVREHFGPRTSHGGHDGADGRGLRYLEWVHDPDPTDTTYLVDFALLMRNADGTVGSAHDRHTCGLFSRAEWLDLMTEAGLSARSVVDEYEREVFLGVKPGSGAS